MKMIELHRNYNTESAPVNGVFCVYTLYNKNLPVYVGQTKNLEQRMSSHMMSDKEFTSFTFELCEESELNNVEASEIVRLNAALNTNLPKNSKYISSAQLRSDIDEIILSLIHNVPVSFYRPKKNGSKYHYISIEEASNVKEIIRQCFVDNASMYSNECKIDNATSITVSKNKNGYNDVIYNGLVISSHECKSVAIIAERDFINNKVNELNAVKLTGEDL